MKQQVYLDTTIPSAYLDSRAPERQAETRDFWDNRLGEFQPVISSIVVMEIQDTPDAGRRDAMWSLVSGLPALPLDEAAQRLAREYIARGVFPGKYEADASHVAIAVVNRVEYLVSWNFRHIVRVSTRRAVNLTNALMGHGSIEIVAPPEL
jgi:predicted nucleic acid-binding protein